MTMHVPLEVAILESRSWVQSARDLVENQGGARQEYIYIPHWKKLPSPVCVVWKLGQMDSWNAFF